MTDERRLAVFMIAAGKGYVRYARGLISRAIQSVLGRIAQLKPPYFFEYQSVDHQKWMDVEDPVPRYQLQATDEEVEEIVKVIKELSEKDGWDQPPVDIYHD